MNDIARLAADLAYAAGRGARQVAGEVEHGGATVAQIGVQLPGSGLLPGPVIASAPAASAEAVASSMAVEAADKGAQLVGGKQ